jgi:hypothetical protein
MGDTGRWVCPNCQRQFGRHAQSHSCQPAGTVDESFAGTPPVQREIYDVILDHLRSLGPVHEDAVQVGVFLKTTRKIGEVRPRLKWLSLELRLPRVVHDRRVQRTISTGAGIHVHIIKLFTVDDVDDDVLGWLTEAYLEAS